MTATDPHTPLGRAQETTLALDATLASVRRAVGDHDAGLTTSRERDDAVDLALALHDVAVGWLRHGAVSADRAALCQGLRSLADFLESHPELPPPYGVEASPHLDGTDAEDRAEVDRIAAILGSGTTVNSAGTHYETERFFGDRVHYRAVAITEAEMAAWFAHSVAYRGPSREKSKAARDGAR
jgi:hypothetical protein